MYEKLKSFLLDDHIFFGLITILIAVSSFCLGRASVDTKNAGTTVQLTNSTINSPSAEDLPKNASSTSVIKEISEISIVASKSGTKFHLLNCPGAKQIKEENKIYFVSKQEALAAGYKPAANCPGLQ